MMSWEQELYDWLDEPPQQYDGMPRASGIAKCVRRQYYEATLPVWREHDSISRRAVLVMGNVAEVLLIKHLRVERECHIEYSIIEGQLEISINISGVQVPGHPDGIISHPILTKGEKVLLECKSMKKELLDSVEQARRIARVFPDYTEQAAVYAVRLKQMGLVDRDDVVLFATMDREGRILPPVLEPIPEAVKERIRERMEVFKWHYDNNRTPDRPERYTRGRPPCIFCPHKELCYGADQTRSARR